MGTGPRRHLQRALWHRHGVAQNRRWLGCIGTARFAGAWGQNEAAQPGGSGAAGAAGPGAAGRSRRTRDAEVRDRPESPPFGMAQGVGLRGDPLLRPRWDAGGRVRGLGSRL